MVSSNLPKNERKKFDLRYHSMYCFLGESRTPYIAFEIYWPLKRKLKRKFNWLKSKWDRLNETRLKIFKAHSACSFSFGTHLAFTQGPILKCARWASLNSWNSNDSFTFCDYMALETSAAGLQALKKYQINQWFYWALYRHILVIDREKNNKVHSSVNHSN